MALLPRLLAVVSVAIFAGYLGGLPASARPLPGFRLLTTATSPLDDVALAPISGPDSSPAPAPAPIAPSPVAFDTNDGAFESSKGAGKPFVARVASLVGGPLEDAEFVPGFDPVPGPAPDGDMPPEASGPMEMTPGPTTVLDQQQTPAGIGAGDEPSAAGGPDSSKMAESEMAVEPEGDEDKAGDGVPMTFTPPLPVFVEEDDDGVGAELD